MEEDLEFRAAPVPGDRPSVPRSAPDLVLHSGERRIHGIEMPPLLTGEFMLLTYLGRRPWLWHSSRVLSLNVYGRDDEAARQLVWKYVSTLRKKVARELPSLIELCRRRGYSCRQSVIIDDGEPIRFQEEFRVAPCGRR